MERHDRVRGVADQQRAAADVPRRGVDRRHAPDRVGGVLRLEVRHEREHERRQPDRFIPRYSMVMFHSEIPYAEAERRGAIQAELLDAATRGCARLGEVDLPRLEAAVAARLAPITPPAALA